MAASALVRNDPTVPPPVALPDVEDQGRPRPGLGRALRVVRLTLAALLTGLGLLTVTKAPTLAGWVLTLLATEFGHWLALSAAGVAGLGMVGRRSPATIVLAAIAGVLLLSPAWRAAALERTLPAKMAAAFGVAGEGRRAWSWPRLFLGDRAPPAIATETHAYPAGNGDQLGLTVYRPLTPDPLPRELLTGIILVHSGGWDDGAREELVDFSRWLTTQGAVVFAIDYRLAPQWTWPAPRDDTRAALRWVRENAAQFRVDPDRLVLFGRSAGAQIALATAYDRESPPVRGVIAFYGPADLHFAYEHGREDDELKSLGLLRAYVGGSPAERPQAYTDASPYFQVRRDLPPTLLIHGLHDTLVWHRQSERLAARLAAAGAPHCFLSLPWATHALEYNLHGPGGQLACAAVARFLASVGAGDSPP